MSRNDRDEDGDQPAAVPIEVSDEQSAGASAAPQRPPSPRNCRDFIRKKTADAMSEIMTAFVDKAKEGSVPHFTSLTKVGGFDQRPGTSQAPKRRRRSLPQRMLDEVERYDATLAAETLAAETQAAHAAIPPTDGREKPTDGWEHGDSDPFDPFNAQERS